MQENAQRSGQDARSHWLARASATRNVAARRPLEPAGAVGRTGRARPGKRASASRDAPTWNAASNPGCRRTGTTGGPAISAERRSQPSAVRTQSLGDGPTAAAAAWATRGARSRRAIQALNAATARTMRRLLRTAELRGTAGELIEGGSACLGNEHARGAGGAAAWNRKRPRIAESNARGRPLPAAT